jgi:hypothetical protein
MGAWSEDRCSSGKTETEGEGRLSEEKIRSIVELLRALLKGKCVGMSGIEAKLSPKQEATSTSKFAQWESWGKSVSQIWDLQLKSPHIKVMRGKVSARWSRSLMAPKSSSE